jgi:hypothetical protein
MMSGARGCALGETSLHSLVIARVGLRSSPLWRYKGNEAIGNSCPLTGCLLPTDPAPFRLHCGEQHRTSQQGVMSCPNRHKVVTGQDPTTSIEGFGRLWQSKAANRRVGCGVLLSTCQRPLSGSVLATDKVAPAYFYLTKRSIIVGHVYSQRQNLHACIQFRRDIPTTL